jgi:mevalonate kinase
MNNLDINQLLAMISKMDKEELEKNINKAQQILNNSNIGKNDQNR